MIKNTSGQRLIVFAFGGASHASPGDPVTGDAANITARLALDGAAASASNDTNPTELEDGFYAFDLTQSETNADELVAFPESSTANVRVIAVPGVVYPFEVMRGTDSAYTGTPPTPPAASTISAAVWAESTRALTDKAGFSLSTAGIQAIWDALTSALTTASSIGKLLIDNLNATVSSRMPTTHINATTGKVDGVATVDVTTVNSDMRGTDGANTTTPLSAAAMRSALGLATANLDTQLADKPDAATINGEVDTALADFFTSAATLAGLINNYQLSDDYAANGTVPTLQQAVIAIHQHLMDYQLSGTNRNVNKVDGSAAFSTTLDDDTNPTSETR